MCERKVFLYFAYGSNLLAKRIHIQNPSAVRFDIGKLKDHKLGFFGFSSRWGGASATIIPHEGHVVWGAIWEIDQHHMTDLDDQEGVADRIYFPKTIDVEVSDGKTIKCRVYQRVIDPELIENHELFPNDKPSYLYRETILRGALESKLPGDYIEFLKNIEHNGYKGQAEMGEYLDLF